MSDELHLSDQQRAILVALLDAPMTTLECIRRVGSTCLSQRAGELERKGLVCREQVRAQTRTGKTAWVVQASLTELGRKVAEGLARLDVAVGSAEFDARAGSESHVGQTPNRAEGPAPCQLPPDRLFDDAPLRPK